MIRAVIFDMFETLITHYNSSLYFGAQMAADAGVSEERFQALWRPTETDRSIGTLTLEATLEMIFKELQCYSEELVQEIASKRVAAKEECFRHLHSEIIPMLAGLKEQGILIGLISNCFSEEAEVIRRSVLFPYFDAVCLSYEQGVQKPDEEIYHRCMYGLGVEAKECIYIGDGGSGELEAARSLGMKAMQAVWYLKEGTTQPVWRKAGFVQLEKPLDVLKILPIPTHLKEILIVDESKTDANSICGKISCTCGCSHIKLMIYANEHKGYISVKKYKDNYGFRIAGICGACGKRFDIFDMAKHGYEGFVCQDGIAVEDADLKEVACSKCQGDMFEVNVEIELEDREQFVEEVVEYEPEKYVPEDYVDAFNWFTASLQCKKCGKRMDNWVSLETS